MKSPVRQFELLRPRTLREALTMLHNESGLVPLAGGTDLLVLMNAGTLPRGTHRFLDLWGLDELRSIRRTLIGRRPQLVFGALTTFTDCISSRTVLRDLPILAQAAREVGGPQIQNRGTLGGNIGNASPAADSLPVLRAADTELVLSSVAGERRIPLADYFTGYRTSVRRSDELITAIEVLVPPGKQSFRKVGTRAAQAISKVVLAAIGKRIALGSVAPTVVRATSVERYLAAGGSEFETARELLTDDIHPIDDIRSTAAYRLRVAQNLLGQLPTFQR